MKSSRLFLAIVTAIVLLHAAAASAARVDMKDPRRLVGREDDIRIDAQIFQDTVSPSSPLNVTYQVHNLTAAPVAIAHKIADISYDNETGIITLSLGSEVPMDGTLPQMTVIGPGQQKTLTGGAVFHAAIPAVRSPFLVVPRLVQVKVNVLRNVGPFAEMIERQTQTSLPQTLDDRLFDQWLESNDAIFLNTIPVQWRPKGRMSGMEADQRRGTY